MGTSEGYQRKATPEFLPPHEELVWKPVISNVAASADYYLDVWTKLCDMMDESEDAVAALDRTSQLPENLMMELSYWVAFLKLVLRGQLAQLKAALYSSPNMRHLFARRSGFEKMDSARRSGVAHHFITLKPGSHVLKRKGTPEGYLLWLTDMLIEEGLVPFERHAPAPILNR
jgi:hypothetical protein